MATLIHIGYHKTGSSWLQKNLFSNKAGGGFTAFSKGRKGPINELIVSPNALDFDPDAARVRFAALIGKARRQGLEPVVSSERLSGHAVTGGHDSKDLAQRLAAMFPDGRVLIVIREQRGMLLSTYRQYVKAGGPWKLELFLEPPVDTQIRMPMFDARHFAYHRLIRAYQGLFGENRVLVLPYELIRSDPRPFVESIARFAQVELPEGFVDSLPMDEPRNVANSSVATRFHRIVNRLAVRSDLNPAPVVAAPRVGAFAGRRAPLVERLTPGFVAERLERRDRDRVAQAVGNRFDSSNRVTSELCGLDLVVHGYSVGARGSPEPVADTPEAQTVPAGGG